MNLRALNLTSKSTNNNKKKEIKLPRVFCALYRIINIHAPRMRSCAIRMVKCFGQKRVFLHGACSVCVNTQSVIERRAARKYVRVILSDRSTHTQYRSTFICYDNKVVRLCVII